MVGHRFLVIYIFKMTNNVEFAVKAIQNLPEDSFPFVHVLMYYCVLFFPVVFKPYYFNMTK